MPVDIGGAGNKGRMLRFVEEARATGAPRDMAMEGLKTIVKDVGAKGLGTVDKSWRSKLVTRVYALEKEVSLDLFPTLVAYKTHYKVWRNFLTEYTGAGPREIKKMLNEIVHLAWTKVDIPFLWNLALDMHRAVQVLLGLPKFDYLQGHFNERKNPPACKFHYALAGIEDNIIQEVEERLSQISDLSINTYMFDGVIVLAKESDEGAIVNALCEIGEKWKVSFKVVRM